MGCNKPLIRFYVPHDREASGRVYSLASFNKIHKTEMKYEDLMYRKDVMIIPCGQCTGCKLRKRKDWATRMELEAYSHDKERIWFITLTYDDDHVPTQDTETGEIFKGGVNVWRDASERPRTVQTLSVEDVQLFMKRLIIVSIVRLLLIVTLVHALPWIVVNVIIVFISVLKRRPCV